MAWPRRLVVAVISGSGRAGQWQVPSPRMAPPVFAWMPSWPDLNRPGFCGGSQSTGEWDDGSSTEVSGRAA